MPSGQAFIIAPALRQAKDIPGEASRARRSREAADRNGLKNKGTLIRPGAEAALLLPF